MGCILTKCSKLLSSNSVTGKPSDEENITSSMAPDDVIQMEERCHGDNSLDNLSFQPQQPPPPQQQQLTIVNENVSCLDFDFEAELIKQKTRSMAEENEEDENGFTRVSLKRKSSFSDQSWEDADSGGGARQESLNSFSIDEHQKDEVHVNEPVPSLMVMVTPSIVIEADDFTTPNNDEEDDDDMDLLAAALDSDDDCADHACTNPNLLQVPRKSSSGEESEEEDAHFRALMDRFSPSPPPPHSSSSSSSVTAAEDKCSFKEEVAVGSLRSAWHPFVNRSRSILQDINEEFDEEDEEMNDRNENCSRLNGVGNKGYTDTEEDSVCTIDRDCSMDDEDPPSPPATLAVKDCDSTANNARTKRIAYRDGGGGVKKSSDDACSSSGAPPSPPPGSVISVAEESHLESLETVQVLLSSHIQPKLRSSFHSIIIPVHRSGGGGGSDNNNKS